MLTPAYVPLEGGQSPDVLGAVHNFVTAWARPSLAPEAVFRSRQNRVFLPPQSNEYALLMVLGTRRQGRGLADMAGGDAEDDEPETLRLREYCRSLISVALYSDTGASLPRATSLASVFRSTVGVAAFREHGLAALHASDIEEITSRDEARQWVTGHVLTLDLGYWTGTDAGTAWFSDVRITRRPLR